jgi:hypothetical protein
MRPVLLFILLFMTMVNTHGQLFEGIITFHERFINKDPFKPTRNDTTVLYLKNGMLRKPFINNNKNYYLCRGDSSFYVNHEYGTIHRDAGYTADWFIKDDKFQQIKERGKQLEILGYPCQNYKRTKIRYGKEEITFLSIANSLRPGVNFGYFLYKELGIALKISTKFSNGIHEISVVSITPTQLDDEFFTLPDYQIEEIFMEKRANKFIKEMNNGN